MVRVDIDWHKAKSLYLLSGFEGVIIKIKVTSKKLTIFKLEEIPILNPRILNALIIFFYRLDILGPLLFDM